MLYILYNKGGNFKMGELGNNKDEAGVNNNDIKKEKRVLRPLSEMCEYDRCENLPRDKNTISIFKNSVIQFIPYSYKRITEKGYVEDCMIEEMHNIAYLLIEYYIINPEIVKLFCINLFETVLQTGIEYNKNLVAEILTKSELILVLSIYIFQMTSYSFDLELIQNYNDETVDSINRNLLFIMCNHIYNNLQNELHLDINEVTPKELVYGVESGFFSDKVKIKSRIESILKNEGSKDKYNKVINAIINLGIKNYINLEDYDEYLKDYDLYKLIYYPNNIDYNEFDIRFLINCKSSIAINNAIKYGGPILNMRLYYESLKDKSITKYKVINKIINDPDNKYISKKMVREKREQSKGKNN